MEKGWAKKEIDGGKAGREGKEEKMERQSSRG